MCFPNFCYHYCTTHTHACTRAPTHTHSLTKSWNSIRFMTTCNFFFCYFSTDQDNNYKARIPHTIKSKHKKISNLTFVPCSGSKKVNKNWERKEEEEEKWKKRKKKPQPLAAVDIHHIFIVTMFGLYFKVQVSNGISMGSVSYTHLRAHET